MSMNNENLAPRWELGDAITIRVPADDETDRTDGDDGDDLDDDGPQP